MSCIVVLYFVHLVCNNAGNLLPWKPVQSIGIILSILYLCLSQ